MKICIDLTSLAFNFSGIERYAMCISKEMIKNKDNEFVLLFCNKIHPEYKELVKKSNIQTKIVNAKNSKFSKLWLFQVKNNLALRQIKADAYIFLSFEPPILFNKKNIITTIHDLGFYDCPKMWKWYISIYGKIKMRAAIKHSKRLVCVSNFTKNRLKSWFDYPEKKMRVVYNAIDERFNTKQITVEKQNELRIRYNLPNNDFILCLGTIEPRKNMELLIKAFEELKAHHQLEESLVIVGRKGWKINKFFEKLNSNSRDDIRLTGFVDDKDLPDIYKMASFFVFPSVYEGFGIPPLEAISCGTQTIVSNIEVQKEVLGDAAQYFLSKDIEDLKKVLLEAKTIPEKRLEEHSKKFSWKKSGKKYYNFILSMMR